ncbi:glycosyltransferase family 2 protein [Lawsonia intracellularis]|uniref:glycosyltransferase family 2 protein n=1 Tax=Lawsonia intracellularis TaxID=29546 RepID=UPI000DE335D9|nr:glycosyltransferase family 2 protein [Lawsonia intracellularis]RBN32597.1 glycosyltransferase family 2 protein [Lawsonia intracellularis]RBN32783.1 glycosyltransferase family 2 protein [Lawsonia intracellularis]UYH53716.1 glycosyltransferase family 2 protein [Lawsonia intracellularis]
MKLLLFSLSSLIYIYIRDVIVVDDHSEDETAKLAFESGAIVIRHPMNLGQGAALQTGFNFALKEGADIVITFDADGQNRIEDALKMVEVIAADQADIVCGSRFLGTKSFNMPLSKKIWLRLATIFVRMTTGVKVTDAHNGLRALSKKALKVISIKQNRMSHASEIINNIKKHRLRYKEIPVTILYTEYAISKGQKLKNSFNIVKELFIWSLNK